MLDIRRRGQTTALIVRCITRPIVLTRPRTIVFTPLANHYALPALGVAACLLAIAALATRFRDGSASLERTNPCEFH